MKGTYEYLRHRRLEPGPWNQGSISRHQLDTLEESSVFSVRLGAIFIGSTSESHMRAIINGRRKPPVGTMIGSIGRDGERRRQFTLASESTGATITPYGDPKGSQQFQDRLARHLEYGSTGS